MVKKINPLFNRVILKEVENRVSAGGILLPRGNTEKSMTLEVVAVGGEVKRVCVGDKVIIAKYCGVSFDEFFIVQECDILGVIENE
jgi:chaperonin GroES